METKEMYKKYDIAIDAVKIAEQLIKEIDTFSAAKITEKLNNIYNELLEEWMELRMKLQNENEELLE